ncbi:MAG: hypothetical protein ABW036_05980 [Flavitalea sp.]
MKASSLFIFFSIFQHIVTAQVSLQGIGLSYGAYQVGFDHYIKNDQTRSYIRTNDFTGKVLPRPISISIWYPAILKTAPKPMTVVDYMRVLKEEEEWEVLPDNRILDWFYYNNSESNKIHLKETVHAQRKAKPSVGKFPVVIYAPSYQASSAENFALCELLSSYGYIVISSPSRGTGSQRLDGGTTRDLETQARDIQFLIAEISGNPNAELSNLSVIGFSFGGISNVLAQMMDKRIRSVICLDGSVRYQFDNLKRSPYFNIENFDVPFLFMAQKQIPEQVMQEDNIDSSLNSSFAFFDSLTRSNAHYYRFNDLTHVYFSTMGILFADRDRRQDKSDSAIMKAYRLMTVYTLNFLNSVVKEDSIAKVFLAKDLIKNDSRDESIEKLSEKKAVIVPFTFQDFHHLALKENYQFLPALYASIKTSHPEYKIEERKLNTLGLSLLFRNQTEAGINVLTFTTMLFPESSNAFDSLGEGFLIVNDKGNAIENFRISLKLNPQNQNATERLKVLQK